ncbi:hypothetical protein ACN9MB_20510 [Dyella kyungheensis]|uniref:hypothetical protein n=1 Tax=Dyella kyungheensis TaxID=1242174 RepID=UPI003CF188F4
MKNGLCRPDFQVDPHLFWRALLDNGCIELTIRGAQMANAVNLPDRHKDSLICVAPIGRLLTLMRAVAFVCHEPCLASTSNSRVANRQHATQYGQHIAERENHVEQLWLLKPSRQMIGANGERKTAQQPRSFDLQVNVPLSSNPEECRSSSEIEGGNLPLPVRR